MANYGRAHDASGRTPIPLIGCCVFEFETGDCVGAGDRREDGGERRRRRERRGDVASLPVRSGSVPLAGGEDVRRAEAEAEGGQRKNDGRLVWAVLQDAQQSSADGAARLCRGARRISN